MRIRVDRILGLICLTCLIIAYMAHAGNEILLFAVIVALFGKAYEWAQRVENQA